MNFAELYKNNRTAVARALTAMWCGESANESQRSYIKQLKQVIGDLFAPKNAIPVVQCMNAYMPVHSVSQDKAIATIGDLWEKTQPADPLKKYPPYEHQYLCWDTLLNKKTDEGKPMSIVVTTGTGSGKTECFMMPLVYDLIQNRKVGEIQALFLYPLNALMEDQKERLEELLKGTDLTYTVYNGDLPEIEPKETDDTEDAKKLRRRIEQLTGGKYVFYKNPGEKGYYKLEDMRYSHLVYTRKMVRSTPPNIVLTNPTMLEYILLRGVDANLIVPNKKSLRWVAIDETHSYTGAGAAELAMLLRRILLAFNVDAKDIRFATSSATFGNGENKEKDEADLKAFIAGITGIGINQVEAIGGVRTGETVIPHNEDENRWRMIFKKDYISLNELYPGDESIDQKLQMLDEMCQREEARCQAAGKKNPDLKLKVHYFYRVPNNGMFVRLNEFADGSFKIYTENAIGKTEENTESEKIILQESPLLELSRCKHCGEYVALAKLNLEDWTYEPLTLNDDDMFDIKEEEEEENDSPTHYAIFGLSNGKGLKGDHNIQFKPLSAGKLQVLTPTEMPADGEWRVVGNIQRCCPFCNTKQTRSRDTEKNVEGDANGNMEDNRLQKFRLSTDFISRLLAPSILDQLEKGESKNGGIVLHNGQQYISFVDSRQTAAKATLRQNLEQERMWLYSIIYHELCKRKANGLTKEAAIQILMQKQATTPEEMMRNAQIMGNLMNTDPTVVNQQLEELSCSYMSWQEIAELIKNDEYCPVFCSLFIKRSGDSEEIEDGMPSEETIERYIQSIMVMYLSHRPASAAAPETLGLFETCYPQLEQIQLPEAVQKFNAILSNPVNAITEKDWRNLIQVYLDYTVRSNQSIYLRLPNNNKIDIFSTVRFATEKSRRRPFNKPKLEEGKISQARVVRYLCALITRDDNSLNLNEVQRRYFTEISAVVDALWDDMTGDTYHILQTGERLDDDGKWVYEKDQAPRFNLCNLYFKLYDDVYLCDTKADENRHAICLRPIGNNFKRFSPYLQGSIPVELKEDLHETWKAFPLYKGSKEKTSKDNIDAWAKQNRSLLWVHHIWGENGIFSDRLEDIHIFPNLFIQQEHTAQVDKSVARGLQSKFKDHTINILACSTTMEMGVDLGNLEVVMLSSVPPQPSNYKQRAGRSGRNNKVRSACITLCNSDIIGLRTLTNPIEKIINRPVKVPTVDLKSPQVVQRHVNSFLIRAFGVFTDGSNGGRLTQKVADYYTPFEVRLSNGKIYILNGNKETDPSDLLGDFKGTMYDKFNEMCATPLKESVRKDLESLLKDTIFDGNITDVVKNAREANTRCYSELRNKLIDYETAFTGGSISENFRKKLKMQYIEVLYKRLLNFWATSRFTPNANMPVNVLTLDLNSNGKKDFFTSATSSNPSYSLRDAIAQYAPGNSVVVDGVVYIVRGVETTNMYNQTRKAYKTIYRNSDKTVMDDPSLSHAIKWGVNDKIGLNLIQPVGFMPDVNEDKTRIMDSNIYTRVSAQLIDADDWANDVTEPHLVSFRPNRESGNAQILYYNEGTGYGYCYCPQCGRMVLEDSVADPNEPKKFPDEFNPMMAKRKEGQAPKPNFHFAITGKELRKACSCSNNSEKIKRNVIIGDLILTDFCEIRIRHKGQKRWMSDRTKEENLLFTLGIVFTQTWVEILGKERGAIDFAIMPNGHLCIFDCNPGGAGYSNQLANMQNIKAVIASSKKLLEEAKQRNSKDMLLDKFTLRYAKYIDIQAALDWIKEEEEVGDTIPDDIKNAFTGKMPVQATLVDLERAFANSHQDLVLFADNNFKEWDYDDQYNGWQPQLMNNFVLKGNKTTFCVTNTENNILTEPIKAMLREVQAWAKGNGIKMITNPFKAQGFYPLAYIDGNLYFATSKEHAQLNVQWGNDTLFCVKTDNPTAKAPSVDLSYKPTEKMLKLSGNEYKDINTSQLGDIIQKKSDGLVDSFIAYAKQNGGELKISYQDEHIKSILGMILTIQTIEHFVKQIGSKFTLEYKVEEYRDDKGRLDSISRNLPSANIRNSTLRSFTSSWLDDLAHDDGIEGHLMPLVSLPKKALPHWRELTIVCGEKKLSIYPDGGFINEWNIGRQPHGERYEAETVTYDTKIYLFRNKDIKFDVSVTDVSK